MRLRQEEPSATLRQNVAHGLGTNRDTSSAFAPAPVLTHRGGLFCASGSWCWLWDSVSQWGRIVHSECRPVKSAFWPEPGLV